MSVPPHIRRFFADVPINRYLGFELVSTSSEGAIVSARPVPEQTQETGIVHGGIISALADTAAVYAFIPDLAEDRTITSIEFKVNFLHPAESAGEPLIARSTVVRRGGNVGVCEVEVAQGELTVAKGLFTYLFMERRAPA
jgi:uncharacterized protein (TIGR00369 family)